MLTFASSIPLRVAFLTMLLISVLSVPQSASAQRETGVVGSSYTGPTFGFTVEWDGDIWDADDSFANPGYDALMLEASRTTLYFEGAHLYQGDLRDCRDGERIGLAEEAELDDLAPVIDEEGDPIEHNGRNRASGVYEVPEAEGDDDLLAYAYLECRSLIPDSAVLMITGFIDPDDLDDQLARIDDVVDTVVIPEDQETSANSGDLEQSIQTTARDVDGFWRDAFDAVDDRYTKPAYITFLDGVESDCGDAFAGETGPFYCPADETVYLDLYSMSYLERPYGLIVIQMIVAHEIAHHVQELRGLNGCGDSICGREGRSLAIELQADCLAGAWMADAAGRDVVQQGDLKQLEGAIKAWLADPSDTETNDPEAHGDGNARFLMYMKGYASGINSCGFD